MASRYKGIADLPRPRTTRWRDSPFILLLLLLQTSLIYSVQVDWSLSSKPAVFGNTTKLTCIIIDDEDNFCKRKRLQWIGGFNYAILCQDSVCKNNTKYDVKQPEPCTYILVIYIFSEQDVNCDYTCAYGVENVRKKLGINDKDFLYIPKKEEITILNETVTSNISLVVNIKRIYPQPICCISFKDINIQQENTITYTQPANLNTTRSGTLFQTEIVVNRMVSSCSTELEVVCKFGNYTMQIIMTGIIHVPDCHENMKKENKILLKWVLPLGFVVVVACVIIVFTITFFRRKRQQQNPKGSQEMKPHICEKNVEEKEEIKANSQHISDEPESSTSSSPLLTMKSTENLIITMKQGER